MPRRTTSRQSIKLELEEASEESVWIKVHVIEELPDSIMNNVRKKLKEAGEKEAERVVIARQRCSPQLRSCSIRDAAYPGCRALPKVLPVLPTCFANRSPS